MAYEHLKYYVANTLPALKDYLTEEEYKQIDWIDKSNQTPERINQISLSINVQQQRIFARLHFLMLLRQGNEDAYTKFVAGQSEPKLTQENFLVLSDYLKSLSAKQTIQLWIATTVFRSPSAIELANTKLNQKTPFDGVEFLGLIMTKCPEIFPAAAELMAWDKSAKEGFATMLDTGHVRHMMYIEGSTKMFSRLREKVIDGSMDQQHLDLWFSYWLIDITGFRGQTAQLGSEYLNNNTFKALITLKGHLDQLLKNPNYPILKEYLNDRATWLGIPPVLPNTNLFPNNEIEMQRSILARIAAMHRLFTPVEKESLLRGLQRLKNKDSEKYFHMMRILNPLCETDEPTPTYGPALFANLFAESSNYEDAVFTGLPIYADAILQYRQLRSQHQIDPSIALNFSGLAVKDNTKALLAGEAYAVTINPENGTTSLQSVKLEKKLIEKESLSFK